MNIRFRQNIRLAAPQNLRVVVYLRHFKRDSGLYAVCNPAGYIAHAYPAAGYHQIDAITDSVLGNFHHVRIIHFTRLFAEGTVIVDHDHDSGFIPTVLIGIIRKVQFGSCVFALSFCHDFSHQHEEL